MLTSSLLVYKIKTVFGMERGEGIKVKKVCISVISLILALSAVSYAAGPANKELESQMKGALFMNPEDPKANLDLGIFYFDKGIYDEAADYFDNVIRVAPNTEFSAKAAEYIGRIDKSGKPKRFGLNLTLGGQYDSNVILNPTDSPLPSNISNKSDWRGIIYLNSKFNLFMNERAEASIGYNFYQSLHTELTDYNLMQHQAELKTRLAVSDSLSLGAAYSFEYLYLGGDDYDYAHTLSPSLTISEGKGFSTIIEYRYRDAHFMDAPLFLDNSERTGSNNLIGVTQNIPIGSRITARIGYSYDVDSTKRDYWDYTGNKGFAGIRINLPYDFMIDLYSEYYRKGYEGSNPISGLSRRDILRAYSGSISKAITDSFIITIGQTYIDNNSNIDVYTYNRSITSLFLTVRL
jgi:hypothetical protein